MARIKTTGKKIAGGLPTFPKASGAVLPRFARKPGMESAVPSMPKPSGIASPTLSFQLKKRTVKLPK